MDHCCICLNRFRILYPLSKKDDNEPALIEKLQVNVPQIKWSVNYGICDPCIKLLNIVHSFRETCLKSDLQRQQQLNYGMRLKEEVISKDPSMKLVDQEILEVIVKDESSPVQTDESVILENNFPESSDDNHDDTDDYKVAEPVIKKQRTKKVSKITKFQCDKCPSTFPSSTCLVKHAIGEHDMKEKDVRPFLCLRCNRRFGNSSNLLQHIKYHDAVRSNVCSYCGKGFITKTDLNIHEKQHMNKREYECHICSKSFNTHKDLRSHKLVVHTDPQTWKFLCEFCHKRFPIKSNYDCHMRRHTGDKNFQCHICDRKFTDKCVLQRHMRTHSNVREFKCTECSKEYKDKRVLQIHMAKVHEIGVGEIKLPSKERKYICHICPKAYYAKNKLTRHLYTHTGEKPFFCTICDKKFNDKSYVRQHMIKTHKTDISPKILY